MLGPVRQGARRRQNSPDHGLRMRVALLAEEGKRQLWSVDFPSGALYRFSNDQSNYGPDLDGARDGKVLAGIQETKVEDIWSAPRGDAAQVRQLSSGKPSSSLSHPGPAGTSCVSGSFGEQGKNIVISFSHIRLSAFDLASNRNSPSYTYGDQTSPEQSQGK